MRAYRKADGCKEGGVGLFATIGFLFIWQDHTISHKNLFIV